MKNWLTIGKFSEQTGFSPKALRLYDKMNLLISHARGDNGYRYYEEAQLPVAHRLKELKDLGFSLSEIKELLKVDQLLDVENMKVAMLLRHSLVSEQAEVLQSQKKQIENILSSLNEKSQPLQAEQRRAIMSYYGKISILVTGCDGLQKTAEFIQEHFENAGHKISILNWSPGFKLPEEKPYILTCPESLLDNSEIENINADTIIVKSVSENSRELQERYLKLFLNVGPHVTTVINADDRASIVFAGSEAVKKGRIFYYTKNSGLEKQIKNIGGIIGDGEEINLYGLNLNKKIVNLKMKRIMAFEEEIAYLSSLGAVLTMGFKKEDLAGENAVASELSE